MGTACYLKGGEDLIRELENLLGIGLGQVSDDGEFSFESVRCVGCCGLAPVAVCGTDVFGKLVTDKLPEVLAQLKAK
jgi:NADH-quinone oxidoreductase subunit E